MNCVECRDNLVGSMEGLLDAQASNELQTHIDSCAECRAELNAFQGLRERLTESARLSVNAYLANPVMNEVRELTQKPHRLSVLQLLLNNRWKIGFSAATVCVLVVLLCTGSGPNAQAKGAAAVMIRGAQAVARLTSIHLRGQLRTYPQDNFSYINADCAFHPIELWKQFEPDRKWRIEKPQRVVVMDGKSTVMLIKTGNIGVKFPQPSKSAFDTEWLHQMANLSDTITNEVKNALAKKWKLSLAEENGEGGRVKTVVTIVATSHVPQNDYLKNAFFDNADTRRVYRFDSDSGLLEGVQIYLLRPAGEVLIFEVTHIDYNQPIDDAVWKLDLPAEVTWAPLQEDVRQLPDNVKYASMTAEQAARAFLEACTRQDWVEAEKFMSPLNDDMKRSLATLEIIKLGTAFKSKAYVGAFVPYEIKFTEDFYVRVSNSNLAHRYVITGICGMKQNLVQDLKWTEEPTVLPNNAAYANLSPAEVVRAYINAQERFDWNEMKKFDPASDVDDDKAKVELARKKGEDVKNVFPKIEVGEAIWSNEQSSWLVKCHATFIKKWNMALRKDNPAHRWQVDGGF